MGNLLLVFQLLYDFRPVQGSPKEKAANYLSGGRNPKKSAVQNS
jgi:hypothetical protein